MATRTIACSSCGAPIETSRFARSAVCRFCRATVFIDPDAVERARFRDAFAGWNDPATHRFDPWACVCVGKRSWVLRHRLARGGRCDVYTATLARVPTERVLIKLLRADAASGRLDREYEWLKLLQRSSVSGAEHFALRVPQPVARGIVDGGRHDRRHALVIRWASGFVHTLADVRAAYGTTLDPRAAVWMWRRTLETLAFAHRSGVAHGGVTPARLLVHPREHGVMVVGWADGVAAGTATCADDISASARAIAFVLEGASTPAELATLVAEVSSSAGQRDAWAVRERVGDVARACFGPPRFEPFTMPGW